MDQTIIRRIDQLDAKMERGFKELQEALIQFARTEEKVLNLGGENAGLKTDLERLEWVNQYWVMN